MILSTVQSFSVVRNERDRLQTGCCNVIKIRYKNYKHNSFEENLIFFLWAADAFNLRRPVSENNRQFPVESANCL